MLVTVIGDVWIQLVGLQWWGCCDLWSGRWCLRCLLVGWLVVGDCGRCCVVAIVVVLTAVAAV